MGDHKYRICSQCKVEKPETAEYYYRYSITNKFYSKCKLCRTANQRALDKRLRSEYSRRYRMRNYDSVRQRETQWVKVNTEKRIAAWNAHNRKRRASQIAKVEDRISALIRIHLRKRGVVKSSPKLELLGYSVQELAIHLESLFDGDMTWENMGDWQIDHIIPVSAIAYTDESDPLFRAAWSLSNLAPLWAIDNKQKSANIDWQLPDTYKNPKLRAMYDNRNYALVTKDTA
jgi:hypothetical protein